MADALSEPAAAERPLRRDAERNRQRVIAAAREVFATRGLSATLDDVAHRAGVGIGTVYRRFPDKQALLTAAFLDRLEAVAALAEESLTQPDGWAGLTFFLRGSIEMQAADRGLRDVALGAGFGPEALTAGRDRIIPLVDQLVVRAQTEGSLRTDVAETDLPLLIFMVTEVAQRSLAIRPDLHLRYLQLLLDGLHTGASESDLGPPPAQPDLESFGRGLFPTPVRQPAG